MCVFVCLRVFVRDCVSVCVWVLACAWVYLCNLEFAWMRSCVGL